MPEAAALPSRISATLSRTTPLHSTAASSGGEDCKCLKRLDCPDAKQGYEPTLYAMRRKSLARYTDQPSYGPTTSYFPVQK